jgi:periplasmic protein CpxP/Spy
MKKMISAVAVVALSATMAFAAIDNEGGKAWGGHRHRGHKGMMAAHLAKKLNLTDEQKEQWKQINRSFREENKAFFEQARQTHQDFRAAKQAGDQAKMDALKSTLQSQRAQFKQLHEAQESKFVSILTAEQRAQFDALKAERAARRQQHQQKQ